MLETVREYGLERLEEQQANSLMRRLGEYLVALADSVSPTDPVPGRGSPPDSLAAEFDNMRAAVTWALAMLDTELALQLATEFRWFGFKRAGASRNGAMAGRRTSYAWEGVDEDARTSPRDGGTDRFDTRRLPEISGARRGERASLSRTRRRARLL